MLTEQQIEERVRRYEPLRVAGVRGTCSWWLLDEQFPAAPGDKSDLPEPYFARLAAGQGCTAGFTRYYPTREAALADLRNAIRAAHGG